MRRDRGAAALELTFVITLLCTILSVTAPLAQMFQQRITLGRVAGSTARFATRATGSSRYGVSSHRPTFIEIFNKAVTDWNMEWAAAPLDVTLSKDPSTARVGDLIEVTTSAKVDLGMLGTMLSWAGITNGSTVTVTAKAVGRQE
jgi:Flp pilus assembly protein TadG